MIYKRVAIGALARNCEENLPSNILRIEELRTHFAKSSVFVYENNSIDRTKLFLKEWQEKGDDVYLQSEDIDETAYQTNIKTGKFYRGTGEGRIRKMCDCRNKLLDLIRSHGSYDYVIFIDIDVEWFSVEGVISSIENAPEGWSGLFSNCFVSYRNGDKEFEYPMHYDTFAFLKKGKSIEQINRRELNSFRRVLLAKKIYKEVNRQFYCGCESAFGGIGIYKGDIIEGKKYELYKPASWVGTGTALCEHIWFNARVCGAKYISRDLRVRYQWLSASGLRWMIVKHAPVLFSLAGTIKSIMK